MTCIYRAKVYSMHVPQFKNLTAFGMCTYYGTNVYLEEIEIRSTLQWICQIINILPLFIRTLQFGLLIEKTHTTSSQM